MLSNCYYFFFAVLLKPFNKNQILYICFYFFLFSFFFYFIFRFSLFDRSKCIDWIYILCYSYVTKYENVKCKYNMVECCHMVSLNLYEHCITYFLQNNLQFGYNFHEVAQYKVKCTCTKIK